MDNHTLQQVIDLAVKTAVLRAKRKQFWDAVRLAHIS